MCSCIECVEDGQPEDQREGFYEKMWKDFVSLQRGDVQQIAKDAARYRWLRDEWWFSGPEQDIRKALCPDELDLAIDEAIAAIER